MIFKFEEFLSFVAYEDSRAQQKEKVSKNERIRLVSHIQKASSLLFFLLFATSTNGLIEFSSAALGEIAVKYGESARKKVLSWSQLIEDLNIYIS